MGVTGGGGERQKFPGVQPREPHAEHPADGTKVSRLSSTCAPRRPRPRPRHPAAPRGKLAVHTRGTPMVAEGTSSVRGEGEEERASELLDGLDVSDVVQLPPRIRGLGEFPPAPGSQESGGAS